MIYVAALYGLGATALKEFQRTSAVFRTHSKQLTKTK